VPTEWREKRVLAPATVEILSGCLVSLDEVEVRKDLELKLAQLLLTQNVNHLDMDVVQGTDREVTQAIARTLFDEGAAGILYSSKYDNQICAALFEGRARLLFRGDPLRLTDSLPDFERVCVDFRLDP
jgi:hypothetical protein